MIWESRVEYGCRLLSGALWMYIRTLAGLLVEECNMDLVPMIVGYIYNRPRLARKEVR